MDDTNNFDIFSINDLNDDCLIHIFTFLDMPDRLRIERVSKRWKSLAQISWRTMKHLRLDDDFHFPLKYDYVDNDTVTDANVEVLQKVFRLCGPYLRSISFEHDCIELSETVISNIHTMCPNVKDIDIGPECKFSTLEIVCNNFSQLEFVYARHLDFSDGDLLSKLFYKNPKLKSLIISYCVFSAECFSHINHETVEYLSLDSNVINSFDLLVNDIKKFKNLRRFEFRISDDFFSTSLSNNTFSSTIPKTVTINRLLQSITLNCSKLIKLDIYDVNSITDVGFTWITDLLQMESLTLSRVNISDKVLNDLKTLKYLTLDECPLIKNDGLMNLIEISQNIRTINLTSCEALHPEGLIDSIKKSSSGALEVNTFSNKIEGYKHVEISYSFRKVDDQLRIKIKLGRSFLCRYTSCDDGCSVCNNKWEYIYYV